MLTPPRRSRRAGEAARHEEGVEPAAFERRSLNLRSQRGGNRAAVLREQRDFIRRRPKLPVCRFEHARDTQVHRRKSGKHDQANCGHLISPAAVSPTFRMSQNAAYMTVSSSITPRFIEQ